MYEDYAVIPLDLPPPPVDMAALCAFLHRHCEACAFTDNVIRYVLFYGRKPYVDGELLLHTADPRFASLSEDTRFAWDPVFAEQFPALTAWFDALPFTRLDGVTFVTQTDHIREHMDIFGQHNSVSYYELFRAIEPRYYRVIFSTPGDEAARSQSFHITQRYGGTKEFVRLPEDTAAIAMSSSTCYHGAVFNPGHYKTTGVVYGFVDPVRHLELLRRSLAKYADHAIRLHEPGPVGGPAAVMPYQA